MQLSNIGVAVRPNCLTIELFSNRTGRYGQKKSDFSLASSCKIDSFGLVLFNKHPSPIFCQIKYAFLTDLQVQIFVETKMHHTLNKKRARNRVGEQLAPNSIDAKMS